MNVSNYNLDSYLRSNNSLRELKKLEGIDDKYRSLGDEVLAEMEGTFVKVFEAFIMKDYKALKNLTTHTYFMVC